MDFMGSDEAADRDVEIDFLPDEAAIQEAKANRAHRKPPRFAESFGLE
jgi:hypothetical protein